MSKLLLIFGMVAIISATAIYFNISQVGDSVVTKVIHRPTPTITSTPTPTLIQVPSTKIIRQRLQVYQSFNNCGPASLSMLLSHFNINVSQDVLGQSLRPYQNPQGDNDDKSVTLPELAEKSKEYNLIPYHRPNGNLETAKQLIANDIPFIVRTWLNPDEDIGHYRVVRGFDDTTQEFIQDDSYQGKDIRYSYEEFNAMWQPFNYEYLVLVTPEKEDLVKNILGENVEWQTSWTRALEIAKNEELEELNNPYPVFNQAVANYYLGNYEESVAKYEEVASRVPGRMLWYQTEPIRSYLEIGAYDTVFQLTSSILNNQNRGFSELYVIRGKAYEKQGNLEAAKQEYELAVFYNVNSQEAKTALDSVSLGN